MTEIRKWWRNIVFKRIMKSPMSMEIATAVASDPNRADACLRAGWLPMGINCYSPVPDIEDLRNRNVWARRSNLEGVDFRPEEQLRLLADLGKAYGAECDWPIEKADSNGAFYTANNSFGFGCATSLHCMIRHFRPKRVIEIGSGFSSLIISEALNLNGDSPSYTIIDPWPSPLTEGLAIRPDVIDKRVELADHSVFQQLQANDILFIDSGHTVRTGGDVNFLILDVLPKLAPGVLIHFHDIGLPYEYPEIYFTNPVFRMFWTEAYLLQAFLAFNASFEILLAMAFLMHDHIQEYRKAFPLSDETREGATSGSFWIRKVLIP